MPWSAISASLDEDGYALIRQIRQHEAEHGGFLPAVALTGYARAEDRARVLAAGFQAHLPKPVDPSRPHGSDRDHDAPSAEQRPLTTELIVIGTSSVLESDQRETRTSREERTNLIRFRELRRAEPSG